MTPRGPSDAETYSFAQDSQTDPSEFGERRRKRDALKNVFRQVPGIQGLLKDRKTEEEEEAWDKGGPPDDVIFLDVAPACGACGSTPMLWDRCEGTCGECSLSLETSVRRYGGAHVCGTCGWHYCVRCNQTSGLKKHLADVEAELVPELQANLLEAKRSADEAKRRAEDSEKALRDQEGLIIRERIAAEAKQRELEENQARLAVADYDRVDRAERIAQESASVRSALQVEVDEGKALIAKLQQEMNAMQVKLSTQQNLYQKELMRASQDAQATAAAAKRQLEAVQEDLTAEQSKSKTLQEMLEATEKWKEVVKKQLVSEMTRFETQIKATYANASPEEKEKLRAEAERTKELHLLTTAPVDMSYMSKGRAA
jgi:hypothetical protein